VSRPGSGLVFNNTFDAGVSQAYINCAIAAEQSLEALCTNADTIYVTFTASNEGQNGDLASNSFGIVNVSYSQLTAALASHEHTPVGAAGVAALAGLSDPSGGAGFWLPTSYAVMLGLASPTTANEDTVTLNTSYSWNFGQDVTNTLEHELSEGGLGRVGGLGVGLGGRWSTMDLFSFNGSGQRDFSVSDDARYFSYNGGQTTSETAGLSFFAANSGSDAADFQQLDVFGTGDPGETNVLSLTDVQMLRALGWNAPAVANDFFGIGTSDILWNNTSNGAVLMWEMNGSQVVGSATIGGGSSWQLVGTGDFNGDGMSDILWENTNNNLVLMWEMNGTQVINSAWIGGGSNWQVVGTGDFNGDGKSDLLWENTNNDTVTMWEMNGTQVASQAVIGGGPGWQVVGVGDFNGDGKSDILWENTSNGLVLMWEMNGTQVINSAWIGGGSNWKVVGVGDFNGDGYSDILWENTNNDIVTMWEMNGTQVIGSAVIGGGSGWSVVGVGDYYGNGMTDILWQNTNNGLDLIWEMNGTQLVSSSGYIGGGGPWSPFNNAVDGGGASASASSSSNVSALSTSAIQSANLMAQGMAAFGGSTAAMAGASRGLQVGQLLPPGGPSAPNGLFAPVPGDASTLHAGTHA
jgi:hypothetical protein